jgi:hypothetical protein
MSYIAIGQDKPVRIDSVVLTGVTSYTSPSWAAQQYQALELFLYVGTTSGATQPMVTLTGLAGTYISQTTYSQGVSAAGSQDLTHWNTGILTTGWWKGVVMMAQGQARSFLGVGACTASVTGYATSGYNVTTSDPTALVITFTGASNARVELKGWPL